MGVTWTPPRDEQLARFIAVQVYGHGYSQMHADVAASLLEGPAFREVWLRRHRELQEAIDREAGA